MNKKELLSYAVSLKDNTNGEIVFNGTYKDMFKKYYPSLILSSVKTLRKKFNNENMFSEYKEKEIILFECRTLFLNISECNIFEYEHEINELIIKINDKYSIVDEDEIIEEITPVEETQEQKENEEIAATTDQPKTHTNINYLELIHSNLLKAIHTNLIEIIPKQLKELKKKSFTHKKQELLKLLNLLKNYDNTLRSYNNHTFSSRKVFI